MKRFILLYMLSALFITVANGQEGNRTESEKRRIFVPYVRATTDCVAQYVGNNPLFLQSVMANSYFNIIKESLLNNCSIQAQRMVNAHDNVYGFGGLEFLTGAYLADVERAVKTRLKSKIDLAQIEINKLLEKRSEEIKVAESVRDTIRNRALSCLRKEAGSMISTSEKAEVIARAAGVFCRSDVDAFTESVRNLLKIKGNSDFSNLEITIREHVTEILTAEIIKIRSEIIKQEPEKKKENNTF